MTTQCVSLWIGPSLGPVERACMRSVLAQGHRLALYCYRKPDGVPAGVELRDAALIVPERHIIRHRNGSVSLFSNRFRYELQRRALGIWLDCDAYLVRPLDGGADTLMGRDADGMIATGILRLPADSPLLPPLLAIFDEKSVMPWLPWRARIAAHGRRLATGRIGLGKLPWGCAGPKALTYLARRHGLAHLALAPAVFYPVPWQDAAWILRPGMTLADVMTRDTLSIHFYNECIRAFKNAPAPPGSVLAQLHHEGRP